MKTLFVLLVMMTSIVIPPEAHALFGHVEAEKARREHAEQQLNISQQQLAEQHQLVKEQQQIIGEQQRTATEQNKLTSKWQTTAFVLGIVAVGMLIVGTAIGSHGRHHAAQGK